ncbi:DUF1343 domain-containing protein [bacterium]|nr:DUF1343 domain-containing protein [bacterium]
MHQTNFQPLENKRVGLVTNHTAKVGDTHLIDILHANPKIKLTALFGPEHGLRGLADAGAKINDENDPKTGVPIFSLYGQTQKPQQEHIKNLDILVYDIQDIGARFYTYISTLGLCMQAAAEAKIPILVLDRPNPLGGTQVAGYVLEPAHASFVGQYPIPIQYGLTIGELATMIKGEAWLPGLESLDLQVAKLENWNRNQTAAGQLWIKPSPNIPDFETALVYPGTCLFEAIHASEGRGTTEPFLTLGAPYINAERLTQTLNSKNLPGIKFISVSFTPRSIPGMSANPRFKDKLLHGIEIKATDPTKVQPVELGIHLVHAFYHQSKGLDRLRFFNSNWITKLAGTKRLQNDLEFGKSPEEIIASWGFELQEFKSRRENYLLYP